ncbi:hypothetical protein AGMMS4957_10810 [Bacteroidia bacterium]|nr:hypothetical protein AGMMS4957_10810 [Bacteroidia bacterium]
MKTVMNAKVNGIDALRELFSNDDVKLVNRVVQDILFPKPEWVGEQASEVRQRIENGDAVRVRYSKKHCYYQHETKKTTRKYSKKEALDYTNDSNNSLFHRETDIRIAIDSDGNTFPRETILQYTNQVVSYGTQSTIMNYIIAHIWKKTDNPLYFGLLWNYCLIPCHWDYLTNKEDKSHPLIKQIKDLIKALDIELYNPNKLMGWKQEVISKEDMPSEETFSIARQLIKDKKIKFIPVNNVSLKK